MQGTPLLLAVGCLGAILAGITLLGAVHRFRGRDRSQPRHVLDQVLSVGAWVMIVAGCLAVVVVLFGVGATALALVVLAAAVNRRNRAEQEWFVSTLAAAAKRLVPLVPAVEAFAGDRRSPIARRARRAAELLREGRSLPDALAQSGRLVTPEAMLMIRLGHKTGALAPALAQSAAATAADRLLWNQVIGRIAYLGFLLLFGVGMGGFVTLKIAPKMAKIFDDFGAELPPVTQAVMGAGRFLVGTGLAALLVVAAVPLFVYLVACYVGYVRWDLPGFGFLTRPHDRAWILDALALVARQGQPLPPALEMLAQEYPKRSIRARLGRAAEAVRAGGDWTQSLLAQRLVTAAQAAVLQSAQRAGNLAWALGEMADSSRRHLAYRAQLWVQVAFPLVILIYAAVAGLFVVGYMMPLVALIQQLVG